MQNFLTYCNLLIEVSCLFKEITISIFERKIIMWLRVQQKICKIINWSTILHRYLYAFLTKNKILRLHNIFIYFRFRCILICEMLGKKLYCTINVGRLLVKRSRTLYFCLREWDDGMDWGGNLGGFSFKLIKFSIQWKVIFMSPPESNQPCSTKIFSWTKTTINLLFECSRAIN